MFAQTQTRDVTYRIVGFMRLQYFLHRLRHFVPERDYHLLLVSACSLKFALAQGIEC